MLSGEPVAQAFEALGAQLPAERSFLQHVLMQSLSDTQIVGAPGLAGHLLLVVHVLRSLPVPPEFLRTLPEDPLGREWAQHAVANLAQRIAVVTPEGDPLLLERLALLALSDPEAVASFLKGVPADDFVAEDFLARLPLGDGSLSIEDTLDGRLPAIVTVPRLGSKRVLEALGSELLSEVRSENGALYLLWQTEFRRTDAGYALLVRADRRAIAEYLALRMTTRDLLSKPNDDAGILVRFSHTNATPPTGHLVAVSSLPEALQPVAGAMHNPALRPETEAAQQTFLVDSWDPESFFKLEKLYRNVFAFTYFMSPEVERGVPSAIHGFVLDGYAYGHMYSLLRQAIPENENARASSVAAASPGVLTIDAPNVTAQRVTFALRASAKPETIAAYRVLHDWSKLIEEKAHLVPSSAPDDLNRLCELLDVDVSKILPSRTYTAQTMLRAGKLVASYCRRLWELLDPPPGVEFLAPDVAPIRVKAELRAGDGDEDS